MSLYTQESQQIIKIQVGDTISEAINFPLQSVNVDNYSNQYLYLSDVERYVPPYQIGVIVSYPPIMTLNAAFSSPPGLSTQLPAVGSAVITCMSVDQPMSMGIALLWGIIPMSQVVYYQSTTTVLLAKNAIWQSTDLTVTFQLSKQQNVLVFADIAVANESNSNSFAILDLLVDGTIVPQTNVSLPTTDVANSGTLIWGSVLAAGTHTVTTQIQPANGTDQFDYRNRQIVVLLLD